MAQAECTQEVSEGGDVKQEKRKRENSPKATPKKRSLYSPLRTPARASAATLPLAEKINKCGPKEMRFEDVNQLRAHGYC